MTTDTVRYLLGRELQKPVLYCSEVNKRCTDTVLIVEAGNVEEG